jgi:hypothetical protein
LQDQVRDLTLVILDQSNSLKTLPCNKNGIVMSRQNELKAKLPKLKRFMNATKIVCGLLPEQNLKNTFDYTYAEQALSGLEKTSSLW